MTTNTIENFAGSDIIDVRDIIARVEELREELQDLIAAGTEAETNQAEDSTEEHTDDHYEAVDTAKKELADWKEENSDELQTLENLLSDLCGNGGDEQWEGDWYPVILIKDSYFEESMDEMIADCYPDLSKDLPCFITVTLDYEMLKQDYTECEFEGDTYYYR